MAFRYDFSSFELRELGYMIKIGKEDWPADAVEERYRIEYLEQLYEELYSRWACDDDACHVQGERR